MSYTVKYGKKVIEKYGNNCWYCGIKLTKKTFSVDHFIPNNNSHISNLRPSCRPCNSGKSNRDLELYRISRSLRNAGYPAFINSTIYLYLKKELNIDLPLPEHKFYFEGLKNE